MSSSSASASDRDMSDCSRSPSSYSRESPYGSPSRQMPQLTNNLTELSCADKPFHIIGNDPHLVIIEQPQNHFRFRYVSEMVGTHGCLLGKTYTTNTNKTKSHPTVELRNYSTTARIRCRLAQCDVEELHPHRLLEDDEDRDVSSFVPEHNSYVVSFAGMGIIHTAKKDVPDLLFSKFSEKLRGQLYNERELRLECENLAKKINLNIVRLKFSAHDIETGKEICKPVFSEPIHNMKSAATNDLKICRISQYCGRPRGGEDVFMLVEKVNKKNIRIRFVELNEDGKVVWSEDGPFLQSEVHHQYAIVFRTPEYKNPKTPVDVKVYIELLRPSDGRTSERKPFTYKADPMYKQNKKRKNNSTNSFSSVDSSSGSISSDIPTTLLQFQNTNSPPQTTEDHEVPLFTLQQLPLQAGSPSHCGLGSALGTVTVLSSTPPNMAHPNFVPDVLPPSLVTLNVLSPVSMTSPPAPMWGDGSSIPHLRIDSEELNHLLNRDVEMLEHRVVSETDWSQYINSYSSMSDIQTEENPLGEFIRTSTGLVADSGRVKSEPSSPGKSASSPGRSAVETSKDTTEYDAFYKPGDGQEVKQLVHELCEIIRNKKGYKNQEVRSKLDRLFNIRLSNGDTFLHMTLCSNQPSFESIVKVISSVNMPSLLNYTNNKQQTILHLAVMHGTPRLVSLLVAKGCDPNVRNSDEDNVVHFSARYNAKCIEALLSAIRASKVSCDLDATNSEQQTALHLAALADSSQSARALLSHGASHNARDLAGRTALHLAAYDGKTDVLTVLMEHIPKSDIDAVDGSGNTALQILCGRNVNPNTDKDMICQLLAKGADPMKHEDSNEPAWKLARGRPEIKTELSRYLPPSAAMHDEVDVKSEPEDEYESADEYMSESGMHELSMYVRELSEKLDANGEWRTLATRLKTDSLTNWFASQTSPTYTLLHHVKECQEELSSKSVALILDDMGQSEAAKIIRRHLD